jgi:hypothetical protein
VLEEFSPRCLARDFERSLDGRDGVFLGDDEQEGDAHGGGASYGPRPGEAEARPRGSATESPPVGLHFTAAASSASEASGSWRFQWVCFDTRAIKSSILETNSFRIGDVFILL